MSETSGTKKSVSIRHTIIFIVATVVVILTLGYLGGYFFLPRSIQSAYQDKNCESVLSLRDLYTNIYPAFILDKPLENHVMECAVYMLADTEEKNKAWQASYDAYQVYAETYPNGLFIKEVNIHGLAVLLEIAKEKLFEKKYNEAMGKLNWILSRDTDNSIITDAEDLYVEIYQSWGADLRDMNDFEGAERIFGEYKAWAQNNQKTEQTLSAQRELAQTYLDWGMNLQSRNDFDTAVTRFNLAVSTDPEPQSSSGPAAQVEANQFAFYIGWGDALVEQKDYARAIEQYNAAVSLSKSNNQAVAMDALANGYIHWAAELSAEDDFLGALKKIDLSQEKAVTDVSKKSAEEARTETYLAFSNSNGIQAQQAMQDAIRKVCELGEKPDLPIFGLDQKNVFAGIYGVDVKLPEKIAATTPNQLQYVACIEVIEETIEYVDFYGYILIRIRVSWNVELRDLESGSIIATVQLKGEDPSPLPTEPGAIVAGGTMQKFVGDPPEVDSLTEWLLSVMK